jgi:DNA-binding LacI/PurR family transcriptional regulator/signal transduction histidine kinase/ActR/RegA family two-component response regulator
VNVQSPSQAERNRKASDPAAQDQMASAGRLRIAVLLDNLNLFSGGYEAQLRDALHARCVEAGHNLLLLYGGPLEAPQPTAAADNTLYQLLQSDSVDGIIVVSSLLSTYCGPKGVSSLVDRYLPARLCSIGIELPGVPSLVLDNRPAMQAVVEHLVADHGCRRIAFLAGTPRNPEAEARLEAYRTVLERHGIAFDPALVEPGHFRANLGKAAMEQLLRRADHLDAVVAANDEMATGAIDVLRQHGLRVPEDIAVTGFDDIILARWGTPPLTTVAQPFERVADWAVTCIEEQIAGRPVAGCTQIAATFIRRQSCGCGLEAHAMESGPPSPASPATSDSVVERIEGLRPTVTATLRTGWSDGEATAARLLDGLRAEVAGRKDAFQQAVLQLLGAVGSDSERHQAIQSAISALSDGLRNLANLPIERALFAAMSLAARSNTTTQLQHRLLLDENYLRLLSVGEQASLAFDLSSLRQALAKGLPNAGVRTVFLSCVTDSNASKMQPIVCLRDGQSMQMSGSTFPASLMLPPGAFASEQRTTFLVLPLASETQILGVIAFQYSEDANAYTAFRNEIATALRSIQLREELVHKSMLHERSVQERLATTKRLESLSMLAGGVAHDLNNALGPLVALPDVILGELQELPADADSIRRLCTDVEIIKVAALRAAQTVKDLLTLGRQGHTAKENFDLNRVVKVCLADSRLQLAQQAAAHVNIIADLAALPMVIRGAESQVARAVGNLLRNAIEAVNGDGEVMVKTSSLRLAAPTAGYETIPAGQYALLAVSDDGGGIAPGDLGHVFEPFFTKKLAKETSGSGLGLAIVHGVVKEHDGFIDVTSTPGVGTTIALYLPMVPQASSGREQAPTAARGSGRILMVDDEPMQLRTGRRVLVRLGYQVEIIDSGLRAYEVFNQAAASGKSPFDLVIMDMILNEVVDGLQIVERIHGLFPTQKAIIMSGHAPSERAELVLRRDLVWLAKPYTMEGLAAAVRQVLEGGDGPA